MQGTVAACEADGWGVVHDSDGFDHVFHSTAIADGSRSVEVGTDVYFDLTPGRQGRWEATAIRPT